MKQETTIPIYSGKLEDFTWVGFGSSSGTNLRECAKVIKPALIFSDRPTAELLKLPELEGIEKKVFNGFVECGGYEIAKAGGPSAIAEYLEKCGRFNEKIDTMLHEFEERIEKSIDLIVLGGYMRFVMDPLLARYKDKTINVHPSDLSLFEGTEKRMLVGGKSVYDALVKGYKSTRSSVIIVDDGVDHGEILTQGPLVEVNVEKLALAGDIKKYVDGPDGHQARQKEISDWPALTSALRMIADGRFSIGVEKTLVKKQWRRVYLDNKSLPYHGHRV